MELAKWCYKRSGAGLRLVLALLVSTLALSPAGACMAPLPTDLGGLIDADEIVRAEVASYAPIVAWESVGVAERFRERIRKFGARRDPYGNKIGPIWPGYLFANVGLTSVETIDGTKVLPDLQVKLWGDGYQIYKTWNRPAKVIIGLEARMGQGWDPTIVIYGRNCSYYILEDTPENARRVRDAVFKRRQTIVKAIDQERMEEYR